MDSLVPDQVRHLAESLVATLEVALVGLLLVVDSRVLLQRRVLSERLVTLGAISTKKLGFNSLKVKSLLVYRISSFRSRLGNTIKFAS